MIQSIVIEGKVIRVIFENHTVVIYETSDVESTVSEIMNEGNLTKDFVIIDGKVDVTDKNKLIQTAVSISFLRQDILLEIGEYNRNDKLVELERILHRIYKLHIEKYIEIVKREKRGSSRCFLN